MKSNFVSKLALRLFKWPAPVSAPYFCMLETHRCLKFPVELSPSTKKILNAFCMALLKIEQRSFPANKTISNLPFLSKMHRSCFFFLSFKGFNYSWKTHESILRHGILKPLTEKMNENNQKSFQSQQEFCNLNWKLSSLFQLFNMFLKIS